MEIEIFFTTLDFGAFKTARMHFYFADESILPRRRLFFAEYNVHSLTVKYES